jgi:hypothetical protein
VWSDSGICRKTNTFVVYFLIQKRWEKNCLRVRQTIKCQNILHNENLNLNINKKSIFGNCNMRKFKNQVIGILMHFKLE